MHTRMLRAAAAAILLVAIGATLAAAGGWATIVADDAAPPEPRAGQEVEYGFTVLQHGVTPAGFEEPTLRLTNTFSGETFDVQAEPSGAEGHFVARFAFPSGGTWSWGVQLRDLLVETPPATGIVLEADGSRPAVDAGQALGAIEQAKAEVTEALRSELLPRIDRLERSVGELDGEAAGLRAELTALESPVPSGDGIPPLGVALLAILGGALAGFAMAWLGNRREPVAVQPVSSEAASEPATGASGHPLTT